MEMKRIGIPFIAVIAVAALAFVAVWLTLGNNAQAQADLPPPANVTVANGDNPGEVVVSWSAVEGASGYTIQWVNSDAARAALHAGRDWQNLIRSVDVEGGATTTHTLTVINPTTREVKYHFRVGSKSGPDAEPASWTAWQALGVQGNVNQGVAVLAAALGISRNASELVALSGPTTIRTTPASIGESAAAVAGRKAALEAQLAALDGSGNAERVGHVGTLSQRLIANAEAIQQGRGALLAALAAENRAVAELVRDNTVITNDTGLFIAAIESWDGQFYTLMSEADVSEGDRLLFSHLQSLAANVRYAHTLLLVAGRLQDPTVVARSQESYESVSEIIRRDVEYLENNGGSELDSKIIPIAKKLLNTGSGFFTRLENRLQLTAAEEARIADNTATMEQLQSELGALAAEAQGMPLPEVPMMEVMTGTPGITDSTVTFGQSAAFSGPSAELGTGMRLGIQAAFEEANDAGGVHGRTLALEGKDDRYESDSAFTNTRNLIEADQVFGLIGAVGTPTTRAALPVAERAGVPFVGAFTGAQLLRGDEQTSVLNYRASYHQETAKMVELLEEAGITKVAVLYQNDSYGQDGLAGVKNALAMRDGMNLVASWYYLRNSTAIKGAAYRIAQAEPEAVIIIGAYAPTAEFIKEMRARLADDPIFMAVSFVGANALKDRLMELEESVSDVYVTQVVPLPGDAGNAVVAAYRAALSAYDADAEPGFVSLEGYLAGRLAIERLEACGAELSRECFLDVFGEPTAIEIVDGLELEFGPGDNQGSDDVFLTAINSDGEYQLVDGIETTP